MKIKLLILTVLLGLSFFMKDADAQSGMNIYQATLRESNQKTPEISTQEMQKILEEKSATVFDPRSPKEYAIDHIPGAINIAPKNTGSDARDSVISEIGRRVKNNKAAPIVLYCNGPVCGKSRRVANQLIAAGYTNVRRYQLGIPIWRVLVGLTEIELEGILYVVEKDQTAVLIDARDPEEFKTATIPGAVNIPFSGVKPGKNDEIKRAKNDGRLPVEDHNTRIIIFGRSHNQARALAAKLAKVASFHNVSYFAGDFQELHKKLSGPE
jgi:rhodanese-related sulfurtransferase